MESMKIKKPNVDEYAPYYATYINLIGDKNPLNIMVEQLTSVQSMTQIINDEIGQKSYAPGKWSVKELFGHIIDTERIMSYRALAIARGETQPLPGFDHDDYVVKGKFNNRGVKSLIDEFIKLRESNIILFNSFDEESFTVIGTASNNKVSVRALIYIITGHAAHHLSVLKEKYLFLI